MVYAIHETKETFLVEVSDRSYIILMSGMHESIEKEITIYSAGRQLMQ